MEDKAHIPLDTGFALATQCKLNQHKKHEMYMANAKVLRLVPNATFIPLTRVGFLSTFFPQKIPTCWYPQRKILAWGGIAQCEPPTPGILRRSGI